MDKIKEKNQLEHVKLPITDGERKKIIDNLPKVKEQNYRYSWLHETNNGSNAQVNVQGVI